LNKTPKPEKVAKAEKSTKLVKVAKALKAHKLSPEEKAGIITAENEKLRQQIELNQQNRILFSELEARKLEKKNNSPEIANTEEIPGEKVKLEIKV
jgi:hypothetical protein